MRIREIVVYLYMIAFFCGLASLTQIGGIQNLPLQQAMTAGFYALVGICGIILANWVHSDGKKIEELSARLSG